MRTGRMLVLAAIAMMALAPSASAAYVLEFDYGDPGAGDLNVVTDDGGGEWKGGFFILGTDGSAFDTHGETANLLFCHDTNPIWFSQTAELILEPLGLMPINAAGETFTYGYMGAIGGDYNEQLEFVASVPSHDPSIPFTGPEYQNQGVITDMAATYDPDGKASYIMFRIVDGPALALESMLTVFARQHWDGGSGLWSEAKWDGVAAVPDKDMIIDVAGSAVTVAADFTAASVDVGASNTASLTVNTGVTLEATEGVSVGGSGTLQLDGTLSAATLNTDAGSTITGTGSIAATGEVMLGGTVAPGSSIGTLSLDVPGGAELLESAVYRCEIGADDAAIANDTIHVSVGELALDGNLDLVATSKLRGPDAGVEWFGEQTRLVTTAEATDSVLYYFKTTPTPLPADFNAAEWGEGHLGRGVFLTRDTSDGENDVPGVSYTEAGTEVHLFQALDGDTNGDAILDTGDIFAILGAGSFLTPGEWDWTEGDFDGDTDVDTDDIFAILATGQWGDFTPYYPEPTKASAAKGEADAVVDLIVNPRTGEVSVDTNGAKITGYMISSDSGALTGDEAATQFTLTDQTAGQIADLLPLGEGFNGVHDLGSVLEGDGSDLALTYTLAGKAGLFKGNVQVVPEPGTIIMLLGMAVTALLAPAVRGRKS